MPPGKKPDSAQIKIGRYLVDKLTEGQVEFTQQELMEASGNTDKAAFKNTFEREYPFFKKRGDKYLPEFDIFPPHPIDGSPQKQFLKEVKERVTILENQSTGKGVDRK